MNMKDNTVGKICFIVSWLLIAINLWCALGLRGDSFDLVSVVNLGVATLLLYQHIAYPELSRLYNPKNWFKE